MSESLNHLPSMLDLRDVCTDPRIFPVWVWGIVTELGPCRWPEVFISLGGLDHFHLSQFAICMEHLS